MVKAEQLPHEVVGAYEEAYWTNEMTVAEALAAAINAWPGMWHIEPIDFEGKIILPLPTEKETSK